MAVSEQELNEALSRAAALMSPEGQRQIEFAGRQNANSYNMDGDFTNKSGTRYNRQQSLFTEQYHQKPKVNKQSGLPKAILESINKNPLNNSVSEYSIEGSVLDNIDYTPRRTLWQNNILKVTKDYYNQEIKNNLICIFFLSEKFVQLTQLILL